VRSNGTIDLLTNKGTINVDRVVLSTGFEKVVPGGQMVQGLIKGGLPVAEDGFPVLNQSLQWHPNLFVSGRLAERTVGPPAPNIAGAKWSTQRMNEPLKDFRESMRGATPVSRQFESLHGWWDVGKGTFNMQRWRPDAINHPVYKNYHEVLGPLGS
jgi:hypothetical protein